MKNNRGFSLTELCIAIALGGMVLLAFMDVMQYMRVMENRIRVKADSQTTQSLAERYMWMHLKNAAPSFNNLPMLDDTNQKFFDLNRDLAATSSSLGLTRKLTMNLTGGKTVFTALLSESTTAQVQNGYPEVIFLDPTKFYNISLGSSSNIPLNWDKFRNFINALNPNFLVKATQVLEVYIPSTMRNVGAATTVTPNSTSYFLRCTNVPGSSCSTEDFGGLVSFRNAQNNAIAITDFDNYLKTIPPAGGGIPPILARSVRLIRYELKPNTVMNYGNDAGDLYYSTWNGAAYSTPVLIADRIIQVVFARPNISDPTITIDVTPQTAQQRLGK
ncbi:MAG: prepilin-type N-terminal cleavage/methylation domain-containing protein [Bdellovibrionales bacterium]|nr:prepilin-type N-terminal cleavage/methylation domain-containing protein [Bdellovibrionales bacterium]